MFDVKKNIIFENKHIIVIVKPPGILSQSGKSKDKSMVDYLSDYMINSGQRKKTPFIGLIHRLDRNVGGVMVFGKTKEGTAEINKQMQNSEFKKKYLAAVIGIPNEKEKILEDYLIKNSRTNASHIGKSKDKNGKIAKLKYKLVGTCNLKNTVVALLDIELFTGRHHQIRVQLSSLGHPIVGDIKYGDYNCSDTLANDISTLNKENNLNLWSYYIKFKLPFDKEYKSFTAYPKTEDSVYLISEIMKEKEDGLNETN